MTRARPENPRLPDWPERLAALVEARRDARFAWGVHDCCLFAADAVEAMTGSDPAAAWRGSYNTEAGAEAIIGPLGLEGMAAAALEAIGAGACDPAFAQRGDVVLVLVGNQPTMGVCTGDAVAAPGPDGLVFVGLGDVLRAWSV